MLEGLVEAIGTLGREQVNPLATTTTERLLHELSSDTAPSMSTMNDDHRKMRLNDAIALHLRETHDACG
jgi:hypothetical protein